MSFDQFSLPPFISDALKAMNFNTPTPIQEKAIPIAMTGKDLLGMAQTGTGKTAAFGIPLMTRLHENPDQNGLILVPTRELALQVYEFLRALNGKGNMNVVLIVGGAPMGGQFRDLQRSPRIIVATPGRLVDHMGRNPKLLSRSSALVLDEADHMLDMGFLPQVKVILRVLPKVRHTMMFSATFPKEIKALANEFLVKPVMVSVGEENKPIKKIQQVCIQTIQGKKNDIILDELNEREGSVLIFTRTKHRADKLNKYLQEYGYKVAVIHGNRSLAQRRHAIDGFRKGDYRILVATDIAARGIDIADIAHVINYDLPQVPEDYVHRIGRTARNGKGGQALAFVVPEDKMMWRQIVRLSPDIATKAVKDSGVRHEKVARVEKSEPSYKPHQDPRRAKFPRKDFGSKPRDRWSEGNRDDGGRKPLFGESKEFAARKAERETSGDTGGSEASSSKYSKKPRWSSDDRREREETRPNWKKEAELRGRPRDTFGPRKEAGERADRGARDAFGDRKESSFKKPRWNNADRREEGPGDAPRRSFGDRKEGGFKKPAWKKDGDFKSGPRKPFGERKDGGTGSRKTFGERKDGGWKPRGEGRPEKSRY